MFSRNKVSMQTWTPRKCNDDNFVCRDDTGYVEWGQIPEDHGYHTQGHIQTQDSMQSNAYYNQMWSKEGLSVSLKIGIWVFTFLLTNCNHSIKLSFLICKEESDWVRSFKCPWQTSILCCKDFLARHFSCHFFFSHILALTSWMCRWTCVHSSRPSSNSIISEKPNLSQGWPKPFSTLYYHTNTYKFLLALPTWWYFL